MKFCEKFFKLTKKMISKFVYYHCKKKSTISVVKFLFHFYLPYYFFQRIQYFIHDSQMFLNYSWINMRSNDYGITFPFPICIVFVCVSSSYSYSYTHTHPHVYKYVDFKKNTTLYIVYIMYTATYLFVYIYKIL